MRLEAFGVTGIGEVAAGDDVAALVATALAASGESLRDGDVVVVSSKVVSKAEGRVLHADSRDAAITSQTVRVVAERTTPRGLTRIVASRSGPVLAAAGVDNSNVAPGTVLLLPADPDASARALRARFRELTGARAGVVVSDTAGRAWRDGQVDIAIGAAGVAVTDDLRGAVDGHGQQLEVTVRAVADELASLGDLVKGKLAGVPVAVVRGLEVLVQTDDTTGDGPGAAALVRRSGEDWFRYGHVEAVRASLGIPPVVEPAPGKDPAPASVPRAPVADRLRRALDVALAAPDPVTGGGEVAVTSEVTSEGDVVGFTLTLPTTEPDFRADVTTSLIRVGSLLQRITAAGWAEDLEVRTTLAPRADGEMPGIRVAARDRPLSR